MASTRHAALAVLALAAFVFLSSWLGLTGRFLFVAPGGSFAFMGGIWAASLVADAAFVAGSVAAAVLAWRLARGTSFVLAALASAAMNWAVYAASFLLLPPGTRAGMGAWDAKTLLVFVGMWGIVGLVFAALAPPLAAAWWARREAPATEPDAAATPP